ncbi:MAG: PKD domain-containing protein [Bacteroidales bacterium]|nr:PKD domain-containing protein [Bacteroidales bacterium]
MKSLKLLLIVAISAIVFSGCAKDPLALFSVDSDVVYVGDEVTFKNASVDADSYYWDFGDGKSSTEFSPKHTYEVAGTYTVYLHANTKKNASVASLVITVKKHNEFVVNNIHYPITEFQVIREEAVNGGMNYYLYFYNKNELIYNSSTEWFSGSGNMLEIDLYANSLVAGTYRYNTSVTPILGTCNWLELFTDYNFDTDNGSSIYANSGSVVVTKDGNNYTFDIEFTDDNGVKVTGYVECTITATV